MKNQEVVLWGDHLVCYSFDRTIPWISKWSNINILSQI